MVPGIGNEATSASSSALYREPVRSMQAIGGREVSRR